MRGVKYLRAGKYSPVDDISSVSDADGDLRRDGDKPANLIAIRASA